MVHAPIVVHEVSDEIRACSSSNLSLHCCTATGKLLSLDDRNPQSLQVIEFPERLYVDGVACSDHHSIALARLGQVFVWRHPSYGRLGVCDADTYNEATPTEIVALAGTGNMQRDGTFNG